MGRRDEVLKEKIEVSLDGRQVFYLFFGGAVVCALCFVLGITIGRRVEARSLHLAAAEMAHDPLAALDQLEAADADSLVFPEALLGKGGDRAIEKVDDKIADAPPPAAVDPLKPVPVANPERPAPEPAAGAKPRAAKPAPTFTLQLSSFRERDEAVAFRDTLKQAGYEPYMTTAEVPGRGRFYRVRIGKYSSFDAALTAKVKFEERQKIIAYVTRVKKK